MQPIAGVASEIEQHCVVVPVVQARDFRKGSWSVLPDAVQQEQLQTGCGWADVHVQDAPAEALFVVPKLFEHQQVVVDVFNRRL